MASQLILAPGREKSLLRRHPWIFSGAVARVQGNPALGETVEVRSQDGRFLAWAAYSPFSQIRARVWSFDSKVLVHEDFFEKRLIDCISMRQSLGFSMDNHSGFRLVHGESDGLPGCIVDCYGPYIVCQFLSAGWESWRTLWIELLRKHLPNCQGIYERSDTDSRSKEGLEPLKGLLYGNVPAKVLLHENGMRLELDLIHGHKTGYYLDQRDARKSVGLYAKDREVLNAFSYTGGFGIQALLGGASRVTQLDISKDALEIGKLNHQLNDLDDSKTEWVEEDVFKQLRLYRDQARSFDLIVLDPPKFADSQGSLDKASRGYKDINLLALKLLRPGGLLFTFSCSGQMVPELFHKIVADAAVDAKKEARILYRFGHPADHPVSTAFPEGHYLKGLLLRV